MGLGLMGTVAQGECNGMQRLVYVDAYSTSMKGRQGLSPVAYVGAETGELTYGLSYPSRRGDVCEEVSEEGIDAYFEAVEQGLELHERGVSTGLREDAIVEDVGC